MKLNQPYSYTSAKSEALRLQLLFEERNDIDALNRAAALGNADAAFVLGVFHRDMGDELGMRHWLSVADEEGSIDATCMLLDIAINPDAEWKDIERYAQRIVDAPYIESDVYKTYLSKAHLWLLMGHFRNGDESQEQLLSRVERLANAGDALAQELMARLCTSGLLKENTLAVAKKWYRLSAENGNARAQDEYANLLLKHWTDKAVFAEAFEWQKKSAEAGYGLAEFNLAGMYYEGIGTKRDVREAVKWLDKAAQHGNACAMRNLSELLSGIGGVELDLQRSRALLRQSANLGEGNANCALALQLLAEGGEALREAGYRLIVFHKICKVESSSDWMLVGNQIALSRFLTRNSALRERMEKALSFYTEHPQALAEKIVECCTKRAKRQIRQINDDKEGIVVNLHYIGPCNFNCKTCYFPCDSSMLSLESWKRIVDQLVFSVKIKRFNLAGGEPLLAKRDFVQGLIDHIHLYGIDVSIITNGYFLSPEFIDSNRGKVGMIGISVDGTTELLNKKIGRATKDGKTLPNERLHELADCIHAAGMQLKINTQIMKPNCEEDFHDLISRVRPEKWKLLRTSIREDVNSDAKGFVATEKEFENFVSRHTDLHPIVEDSDDIKNAYYMVFQYGEFVHVDGDSHLHMMPLSFGDARESIDRIPHNAEGYRKRYSDDMAE